MINFRVCGKNVVPFCRLMMNIYTKIWEMLVISFFSWKKDFEPLRCYFYDLVYFALCLGKNLVALYIILETKLFALGCCYF